MTTRSVIARVAVCVLAAALGLAGGCSKAPTAPTSPGVATFPPKVTPPLVEPPTIQVTKFMAFGDSLTEGEVQPNIAPLAIEIEHAYPTVVLQMLQARYSTQQFTMANDGIGGQQAALDTERFETALVASQPQVVLLLQGVVDLNKSPNDAGVDAVAHALRDDIRAARAKNAYVFLSTLLPEKDASKTRAVPENILQQANAQIRDLARTESGVTVVDGYAAIAVDVPHYVGGDGLHLTVEGYQALAAAFFDAIKAKYEDPAPPPPVWSSGPSIASVGAHVEIGPERSR